MRISGIRDYAPAARNFWTRSSNRSISARIVSGEARYASGLARITTSKALPLVPLSRGSNSRRTCSRNRRLRRLRPTADCPCFGTMNPTRLCSRSAITTRASRCSNRNRFPWRATASNSAPCVSRSRREKRRRCLASNDDDSSGAGVLGWQLNRETLAAFLPAPTEYFAPPSGGHALTKSVRANASLVAGTISGLAHGYSKKTIEEIRRRPVNVFGAET